MLLDAALRFATRRAAKRLMVLTLPASLLALMPLRRVFRPHDLDDPHRFRAARIPAVPTAVSAPPTPAPMALAASSAWRWTPLAACHATTARSRRARGKGDSKRAVPAVHTIFGAVDGLVGSAAIVAADPPRTIGPRRLTVQVPKGAASHTAAQREVRWRSHLLLGTVRTLMAHSTAVAADCDPARCWAVACAVARLQADLCSVVGTW